MSQPLAVSARSVLIAGVSAAVVGAGAVTPVDAPAVASARIAAVATQLTSITTPIEDAIKNTYNVLEPWAAYGADLGQWALSFVPGLWWVAPGIDFAYFTAEPLVQAGVYTAADVVGLDFAQIGPDITTGFQESAANAVTYGLAWLNSLVPLPPFPPFPPLPGASVPAGAASLAAGAATVVAGPQARSITTPIEVAIKNTYNAIQPWAAWGAALGQWALSWIPGLWWAAPGISLAYYSIEPLVRAGVYTFADVIGLNFGQIGPDIATGVQTSATNFVNYGLAWLRSLVPLPPIPPFPPLPGAAVSAPAASVRAAAALTPAEAAVSQAAPIAGADSATPGADTSGKANGTPVTGTDAAVPAVATPAAEPTSPATETAAPAVESTAPAVEAAVDAADAAAEASAPDVSAEQGGSTGTQPTRATHRTAGTAAAAGASEGASGQATAGRHGRGSQ